RQLPLETIAPGNRCSGKPLPGETVALGNGCSERQLLPGTVAPGRGAVCAPLGASHGPRRPAIGDRSARPLERPPVPSPGVVPSCPSAIGALVSIPSPLPGNGRVPRPP